jgi:hypothetical protein
MSNSITCPVSSERIGERQVRLTAAFVVVISLFFIALEHTNWGVFTALFLAADFGIRAFTRLKISLLGNFAAALNALFFRTPDTVTDRAPKRFAASIGFVFALSIALFGAFDLPQTAQYFSVVLLICATLEAALGICIGCWVYHKLVRFFPSFF